MTQIVKDSNQFNADYERFSEYLDYPDKDGQQTWKVIKKHFYSGGKPPLREVLNHLVKLSTDKRIYGDFKDKAETFTNKFQDLFNLIDWQ